MVDWYFKGRFDSSLTLRAGRDLADLEVGVAGGLGLDEVLLQVRVGAPALGNDVLLQAHPVATLEQ